MLKAAGDWEVSPWNELDDEAFDPSDCRRRFTGLAARCIPLGLEQHRRQTKFIRRFDSNVLLKARLNSLECADLSELWPSSRIIGVIRSHSAT